MPPAEASLIEGLTFHHLAILTDQPQAAAASLAALGYQVDQLIHCPFQKARLGLARSPAAPTLEIVAPDDDNRGLKNLLQRRGDFGYHLCWAAADPAAVLASPAWQDIRPQEIAPPAPSTLFGGQLVSFHVFEGLGLIELLHLGPQGRF